MSASLRRERRTLTDLFLLPSPTLNDADADDVATSKEDCDTQDGQTTTNNLSLLSSFDSTTTSHVVERHLHETSGLAQHLLDLYRGCISTSTCVCDNHSTASTVVSNGSNEQHAHNNKLVMITGPSGVGKSSLAVTLKEHVESDGGFLCRGKFDAIYIQNQQQQQRHDVNGMDPTQQQQQQLLQSSSTYSSSSSSSSSSFGPFVTMINDWIQQVIARNDTKLLQALQQSIQNELDSSEIQVMEESISSLWKITKGRRLRRRRPRRLPTTTITTTSEIISTTAISNPNDEASSSSSSSSASFHPPPIQHHHHRPQQHWQGLKGIDAKKRYMHIFSKLIHAIASPDAPLVMILDDIQWANVNSIELIKQLASSLSATSITTTTTTTTTDASHHSMNSAKGWMLICTLRLSSDDDDDDDDNDDDDDIHRTGDRHVDETPKSCALLVKDRILRQEGGAMIPWTEIEMGNLPLAQVHLLVSSMLRLPLDDTQSLSAMIHQQTHGNPFFIIQFLSFLCGQGLLYRDPSTNECTWKTDVLMASEPPAAPKQQRKQNRPDSLSNTEDDPPTLMIPAEQRQQLIPSPTSVTTLLARKMLLLSKYEQRVLQVAACLGGTIHESLLVETIIPSAGIRKAILTLIQQGFITFDTETGTGRFLHDRIQEAAYYHLIPEHARAAMHLDIGLRLWIWLDPAERETHLFTIANQIIHGMHLLDDPVEKEELAAFMLKVGEKALLLSCFSMAAVYLDVGMKLLGRKHWTRQYKLSLELYNAAVEVHYYNGNLARVDMLLEVIFKRATSLDHKLRAHFIQIYSLGSRDNMAQALEKGLEVLKLLGETFPRNPSKFEASFALAKCRWILRRKSDDEIMNLPAMTDNRKQVVMRLLNTIFVFAWLKEELIPLMVLRMIDITIRNGMSPMSRRGQVDEGYRYCCLGVRIMEKLNAKEWQCRVALAVVGGVYYMKHPIHVLVKHLLDSHRAGLVVGDIHFSVVCASLQCRVYFFASMPLSDVERLMEGHQRLCDQYGQHSVSTMLTHQRQVCFNLMEKSADPLVLTGDLMDEIQTINVLKQGRHGISLAWLLVMKHMLAVYFYDLDSALAIAAKLRDMKSVIRKTGTVLPFVLSTHLFLEGLVLASLSRTDKKHVGSCRVILEKLKSDKRSGQQNFDNKIYLLKAQMAAAKGDRAVALVKYKQSFEAAERAGFLNEQALAYENAGRALMDWKEPNKANDYLTVARCMFEQWGALAKVKQVDNYLRENGF